MPEGRRWAWQLDHGDYDAVAGLFTDDALLVTGGLADFEDVLVAGSGAADRRWYIAERRIIPVFRDPSRAPSRSA